MPLKACAVMRLIKLFLVSYPSTKSSDISNLEYYYNIVIRRQNQYDAKRESRGFYKKMIPLLVVFTGTIVFKVGRYEVRLATHEGSALIVA